MSTFTSLVMSTLVLSLLAPALPADADTSATQGSSPVLLDPSLADATAPERFTVRVETTEGPFTVEVVRAWAPHGADRFYNLVRAGFYDGCAFFRVIDGFVAQVGIHPDPEVTAAWKDATIPDDPQVEDNTRGTVTFAKSGAPDSRTTQIFVNYGDNTRLRSYGGFAPFGRVVEGMEVVDALYSGYGEGAPRGRGPSQGRLTREGASYLEEQFPKLDRIVSAEVVETAPPPAQ